MATKTGRGITVDDAFLRKFLERGGQAATPTGTPVSVDNVTAFLQDEATAHQQVVTDQETQRLIDQATKDDQAAKLHEKVEEREKQNADREQQAAIKRAEQEEREQQLERDAQIRAAATFTGKAKQAVGAALAPAQGVADRIAAAKTGPGGIGFLLVVIAVLIFTVVQVNSTGDTRMKQLWYMLNGRTELAGRKPLDGSAAYETADAATDFARISSDTIQVISDLTGVSPAAVAGGIAGAVTSTTGIVEFNDPSFRDLP